SARGSSARARASVERGRGTVRVRTCREGRIRKGSFGSCPLWFLGSFFRDPRVLPRTGAGSLFVIYSRHGRHGFGHVLTAPRAGPGGLRKRAVRLFFACAHRPIPRGRCCTIPPAMIALTAPLLAAALAAPGLSYRVFTSDNGLPQNSVYAIDQTPD